MMLRGVIIAITGLFLYSCTQPAYQRPAYQSPTVTHQYELSVKDINGNPVEGAAVSYTISREDKDFDSGKFMTKLDGKFSTSVSYTSPYGYKYFFNEFSSELKYEISKEGYYKTSGSQSISYATSKTETETVTLFKPSDYINTAFLSSPKGVELKAKIITFIDLIRLQSLLVDAELRLQSINLVTFKEKDYLQFTFVSSNIYNSLQLNKYDIGKRLFDDVVRKVLNPLNEHISNPKMFYGYDLKVIGHTKNFVEDKYSSGTPIEYGFMIPEDIVRKYKNKDISGQTVLDSSVILMDDERIELKLQ